MNNDTGTVKDLQTKGSFGEAALDYEDFWPQNLTPQEKLSRARFETFNILMERMNSWLAENTHVNVQKFQTVEKKVSSLEEFNSDTVTYSAKSTDGAWYMKGLRVWYATQHGVPSQPEKIGYSNFLPRIIDDSDRYPVIEKLSSLFQSINCRLQSSPLPGEIITIETVSVPLHGHGPYYICPNKNKWPDGYFRHVFSFVRIFYRRGEAVPEIIGAADFVPEYKKESKTKSKFAPPSSVFEKINDWLQKLENTRIVNMQWLETPYPKKKAENIDSSINWIIKYEEWKDFVKFTRVYYARPMRLDLKYSSPQHISVKTFIPSPTMKSCRAIYTFESMSALNHYVKEWLRIVGNRVIFAELKYRTKWELNLRSTFEDSNVSPGHWFIVDHFDDSGYDYFCHQLVNVIRVYLEGTYTEPPPHLLPPPPVYLDKRCCIIS